MLREENARIFRELKNSIHKIDNWADKSKTMYMNIWREGKIGIVDPIGKERETEKRQKRIGNERQRIAKTLKKFNDAIEAKARKSASMRDVLRFSKFVEKTIPKYVDFFVKNVLLLDKYLLKCPGLFKPRKNEKDTAQWFNLEDIKNANDLRQCWNFIWEWKRFFYHYKKLKWGEKSGRKAIDEKMWSEIRDYYYKELKQNKKIDKAMRYEIIEKKFNEEYKAFFPGKRLPVPQADGFWRKFYSIKDEYSKKPTAIKIK